MDKWHQKSVVTLPTDKKVPIYTILLIFNFYRMNFSVSKNKHSFHKTYKQNTDFRGHRTSKVI